LRKALFPPKLARKRKITEIDPSVQKLKSGVRLNGLLILFNYVRLRHIIILFGVLIYALLRESRRK